MSVDFDRSRVTLVDHPLVQHKLTIMRDENTGSKQFRELVKELALFEGYEATRDFPLEDAPVTTPICETTGKRIAIPYPSSQGLELHVRPFVNYLRMNPNMFPF